MALVEAKALGIIVATEGCCHCVDLKMYSVIGRELSSGLDNYAATTAHYSHIIIKDHPDSLLEA